MTSAADAQSQRGIGAVAHLFLTEQSQAAARRRPPQVEPAPAALSFSQPDNVQGDPIDSDPPLDEPTESVEEPVSALEEAALLDTATDDPVPAVTVSTTCANDDVITAYKTIKQLTADPDEAPEVCLLVCEADEPDQAQAVFDRIADACLNFLELPITYAGCRLCDESDDESSSELLECHDDRHNASRAAPAASAEATVAPTYPVHRPICLDAFPADDAELAGLLADRVDEWLTLPGAAILEFDAEPVLPAGVTVIVDGSGRLHVCAVTLDTGGDLWSAALTARAELLVQRYRLAVEQQDRAIDAQAAVGLIVAAPVEKAQLNAVADQLDGPAMVRQLCLLDHPAGPGLLVL